MIKMIRMKLYVTAFLTFLLLLTGTIVQAIPPIPYVPPTYEYTPGRYGGVYRTAELDMASTLIPNIPGGLEGYQASLFYPVLVCLDYGVMYRIPIYGDLAKWWEVTDDCKIYTFYLVDNAKWWDGVPVTAHDVKYTYDFIIQKRYPAYGGILKFVDKIEVINNFTLRITLNQPHAAFVQTLAMQSNWNAWILPKHIFEGSEWEGNPRGTIVHPDMENPNGKINPNGIIGCGPFIPTEFSPGEYIVAVRYDFYHHGRPYVDKVIMKKVPDPVAGITAFKAGEYDFLTNSYAPNFGEIGTLNQTQGITVLLRGWVYDLSILFNLRRAPFNNLKVRQAIAMAIDRERISQVAFNGYYPPTYWACIPFMEWYQNKNATFPPYNKTRAEELLDEAGYPRQSDGWRFSTTIMNGPYPDDRIVTEAVIPMLREIGIDVTWLAYDGATWASKRNAGDFDLTAYWVNYAPDPNQYYRYFHSQGWSNYMGYYNPRVDELLEAAMKTSIWEERKQYYDEVQEILVQDIPWVPIVNEMYFFFKKEGWHGLPSDLPPDGSMGRMVTWMGGWHCVWHESGSVEAPPIKIPWKVEEAEPVIRYIEVPVGVSWEIFAASTIIALIVGLSTGYVMKRFRVSKSS